MPRKPEKSALNKYLKDTAESPLRQSVGSIALYLFGSCECLDVATETGGAFSTLGFLSFGSRVFLSIRRRRENRAKFSYPLAEKFTGMWYFLRRWAF